MPTPTDLHQNSILSNVSVRYENMEMIANRILPEVQVKKQSDDYYIYGRERYRTDVDDHRARGTEAKTIDYTVTTDTYSAKNYALQGVVADEDRENADTPLSPDVDMTEEVMDRMLIKKEKRAAAKLFSTANITQNTTLSGTNQWDDYSNSDPFGDIKLGIQTQIKQGGKRPNKLVLGQEVFDVLSDHPDIVDRLKYTTKESMTPAMLAALWQLDEVLVGAATENPEAEGATEAMGFIWGKYALLAYTNPRPGIKRFSLGYHLMWGKRSTDKWREEKNKADIIRVNEYYDQKLVAAAHAAYLIADAIS